jgi:hypothetical protein
MDGGGICKAKKPQDNDSYRPSGNPDRGHIVFPLYGALNVNVRTSMTICSIKKKENLFHTNFIFRVDQRDGSSRVRVEGWEHE